MVKIPESFLSTTELPILSGTANKLIAIAGSDVEVDELVDIIVLDPVISGRLIGLANAAFFARANPVFSVKEAVVRVLGIQFTKNLALSMALQESLTVPGESGFDAARSWAVAFGTASLSSKMIQSMMPDALQNGVVEPVYLTGLLHNLGELLAAISDAERYAEFILAMEVQHSSNRSEIFQQYFDIGVVSLSQWLMERWHLPDQIIDILHQMSNIDASQPVVIELASLVCWASRETHRLIEEEPLEDTASDVYYESKAYREYLGNFDDLIALSRQMAS